MDGISSSIRIAGLLVRWRKVLLALTVSAAAAGVFLIPRTRINADTTSILPDNSPMRQALTILESDFPQMDIRSRFLRVMFLAEPPADSLRTALEEIPGVSSLLGVQQKDSCTLYQFLLPPEADGAQVRQAVNARFQDRVLAEVEEQDLMPENLLSMLAIAAAIVLVIMFLMCPSIVETILILVSIGLAVLINMGSNSLLPGVYLITHNLAAVLQMVLSMDFAIILFNRYRQERQGGSADEDAMVSAIAGAAPSILSSGLTTIASLFMLVFMRLKIGMDLGLVLSKGVLCSLLATFTALPALILAFDKAVWKTEKRVLKIPTDGIARFEMRHRIPLAILFAAIFVGSFFLQRQTRISYSVDWPTAIKEVFPPQNNLIMVYPTAEEDAVIALTDSIASDPDVVSAISYPYIALKQRTAAELMEMASMAPGLADSIPEGMLDLLYYAASHPERTERMRIDELIPTVQALSSQFGLSVEFPDIPLMEEYVEEALPATLADPDPLPVFQDDKGYGTQDIGDTAFLARHYSYEEITRQRTAPEMAEYLTISNSYTNIVYRLAGRKGKNATMDAYDFLTTLSDKILKNKVYAAMVPSRQMEQLRQLRSFIEKVYQAGPPAATAPDEGRPQPEAHPSQPDSVQATPKQGHDQPLEGAPDSTSTAVRERTDSPVEATVEAPTPLEKLAEMAFSGKGYTSAQLHRALMRAGIKVSREELDMLYLYYGYSTMRDTTVRLSLVEIADFIDGFADNPLVAEHLDDNRRAQIEAVPEMVGSQLGALRGDPWSVLVVVTGLPAEGDEAFALLERISSRAERVLDGEPALVGYTVMYKEMKDGFPRELLLLTLLTIAAIFIIVALTFRSPVIPLLLIPTVLSAVWFNVFACGIGGGTMLYMAYLIVQSILMGATIDYSILFTNYYRESRVSLDKGAALAAAYNGAKHAILTSGMIIVVAPLVMSYSITDPTIISILRCITVGAAAAIILILFVLPAVLAIFDRWVRK